MTAPAAPLRSTDWIEIVDHGGSIEVAWIALCACGGRQRLLWIGDRYPDARREAVAWADALGGLPVRDATRLN